MAALFLIQVVLGALTQHYRTELGGVFGLRVDHLLPTTSRAPGTCSCRSSGS
jgi:nitric oxide reductase large subunit